jgi:hypothetical protein
MDNSIWVWLIVGAVFVLAIHKAIADHRAYAVAKEAYRDALAALADDPTNTALRQDALRKGRPHRCRANPQRRRQDTARRRP